MILKLFPTHNLVSAINTAIYQIHRLTNLIGYSFENKLYGSTSVLDVAQAFDRVWHSGLLYKLKLIPSTPYF